MENPILLLALENVQSLPRQFRDARQRMADSPTERDEYEYIVAGVRDDLVKAVDELVPDLTDRGLDVEDLLRFRNALEDDIGGDPQELWPAARVVIQQAAREVRQEESRNAARKPHPDAPDDFTPDGLRQLAGLIEVVASAGNWRTNEAITGRLASCYMWIGRLFPDLAPSVEELRIVAESMGDVDAARVVDVLRRMAGHLQLHNAQVSRNVARIRASHAQPPPPPEGLSMWADQLERLAELARLGNGKSQAWHKAKNSLYFKLHDHVYPWLREHRADALRECPTVLDLMRYPPEVLPKHTEKGRRSPGGPFSAAALEAAAAELRKLQASRTPSPAADLARAPISIEAAEAELARKGWTRELEGLPEWLIEYWDEFVREYAADPTGSGPGAMDKLKDRLRMARLEAQVQAAQAMATRPDAVERASARTAAPAPAAPVDGATDDYSTVVWRGQRFEFNKKQAAVISLFFEQARKVPGVDPTLREGFIASKVGAEQTNFRLAHTFRVKGRGYHPAWGTMIVQGDARGTYKALISKIPGRSPENP